MKKLVELLNQFEIETNSDPHTRQERDENRMQCCESEILSKKYLFIERLCENDKIDTEKLNDENDLYFELIQRASIDNVILMLLSIQLRPLKFLDYYLK